MHSKRNKDRKKIICTKPRNEDFRKLLLVCLSESLLVVDQIKKRHKHATEAFIYNRHTSHGDFQLLVLELFVLNHKGFLFDIE